MTQTRVEFWDQLRTLRGRLLEMGSHADAMLADAVTALTEHDVELANKVIAADDVVDALDIQIETECFRLLALQQPVARDLRLVGTAVKVITDIERVADHSVDIAKVARKLAGTTFYKPLVDIPRMATCVRQMLRDALGSFVNYDAAVIDRIITADDEVDTLFHELRDELHKVMQEQPGLVVQASYLLFVAHYLERIADHAVNIAERIYYAETGVLRQLAKSHQASS